MSRRALASRLAVVVAAAATAGTAAASTGRLTLTPIGRLAFPDRGFLVDLPHQTSTPAVIVTENGKRVQDPSFVPVAASNQRIGFTLVIDSSDSMHGPAIVRAFSAGRRFVSRTGPNAYIGVISFASRARTLIAPTADHTKVMAALRYVPATAAGTHVYDALRQALAQLDHQDVSAGAILLLSDGADTGSRTTAASVIAQARAQHVRIFSVGLRTATFRAVPLTALATGTNGAVTEVASSAKLSRIYDAIGRQLANEYVLRYRSTAKLGQKVAVRVRVDRAAGAFAYVVAPVDAGTPYRRSFASRFWLSRLSLILVAVLAMLLVFGCIAGALRADPATLVTRMADFVSIHEPVAAEDQLRRKRLRRPSELVAAQAEKRLSRTAWWTRFKEELEIAEVDMPAEQIVSGALIAAVLLFVVLLVTVPVFSPFALAVPLMVRALCSRKLRKVRDAFASQLPDNLQVLASALRAGHSFVGAFAVVAADADEPSKREFQRVVADEQLGVSIDQALFEVARRMAHSDLEQVALVAELQRQTGGNTAEVLDRVVDTIRARFDLRRLIQTLTAQGRMARWIVSLLPVALGALISLVNPSYMKPLLTTTGGQAALAVAAVMVIAGSLVIKRIVDIKV